MPIFGKGPEAQLQRAANNLRLSLKQAALRLPKNKYEALKKQRLNQYQRKRKEIIESVLGQWKGEYNNNMSLQNAKKIRNQKESAEYQNYLMSKLTHSIKSSPATTTTGYLRKRPPPKPATPATTPTPVPATPFITPTPSRRPSVAASNSGQNGIIRRGRKLFRRGVTYAKKKVGEYFVRRNALSKLKKLEEEFRQKEQKWTAKLNGFKKNKNLHKILEQQAAKEIKEIREKYEAELARIQTNTSRELQEKHLLVERVVEKYQNLEKKLKQLQGNTSKQNEINALQQQLNRATKQIQNLTNNIEHKTRNLTTKHEQYIKNLTANYASEINSIRQQKNISSAEKNAQIREIERQKQNAIRTLKNNHKRQIQSYENQMDNIEKNILKYANLNAADKKKLENEIQSIKKQKQNLERIILFEQAEYEQGLKQEKAMSNEQVAIIMELGKKHKNVESIVENLRKRLQTHKNENAVKNALLNQYRAHKNLVARELNAMRAAIQNSINNQEHKKTLLQQINVVKNLSPNQQLKNPMVQRYLLYKTISVPKAQPITPVVSTLQTFLHSFKNNSASKFGQTIQAQAPNYKKLTVAAGVLKAISFLKSVIIPQIKTNNSKAIIKKQNAGIPEVKEVNEKLEQINKLQKQILTYFLPFVKQNVYGQLSNNEKLNILNKLEKIDTLTDSEFTSIMNLLFLNIVPIGEGASLNNKKFYFDTIAPQVNMGKKKIILLNNTSRERYIQILEKQKKKQKNENNNTSQKPRIYGGHIGTHLPRKK